MNIVFWKKNYKTCYNKFKYGNSYFLNFDLNFLKISKVKKINQLNKYLFSIKKKKIKQYSFKKINLALEKKIFIKLEKEKSLKKKKSNDIKKIQGFIISTTKGKKGIFQVRKNKNSDPDNPLNIDFKIKPIILFNLNFKKRWILLQNEEKIFVIKNCLFKPAVKKKKTILKVFSFLRHKDMVPFDYFWCLRDFYLKKNEYSPIIKFIKDLNSANFLDTFFKNNNFIKKFLHTNFFFFSLKINKDLLTKCIFSYNIFRSIFFKILKIECFDRKIFSKDFLKKNTKNIKYLKKQLKIKLREVKKKLLIKIFKKKITKFRNFYNKTNTQKKLKIKYLFKKKKKYKKFNMKFWLLFYSYKFKKFHKIKLFYKKYLIFFSFFKKFICKKLNKKIFKSKLFKSFFWSLESKLDIFLIRNGFSKNLIQSNFLLRNRSIYLNGKEIILNYFKVKKNDILQILFHYFIFIKSFFLKVNMKKSFTFFYLKNLHKKKKYPFYIEINYKIYSCILIFKPEPFFNIFNLNVNSFNFFFYKYLFYFVKKKTF